MSSDLEEIKKVLVNIEKEIVEFGVCLSDDVKKLLISESKRVHDLITNCFEELDALKILFVKHVFKKKLN